MFEICKRLTVQAEIANNMSAAIATLHLPYLYAIPPKQFVPIR